MGRQRTESRLERERSEDGLGKQYCSVAAIGAAAAIGGGLISAQGAKSAAGQQSEAADRATQAQMQAQAQQRADLQPWVQSGLGANSALNRYLGIGGVGSSGVTSSGLATGLTPDQVRQQLMSQYTKNSTGSGASGGLPGLNLGTPANPADAYNQMLQYQKYAEEHPGSVPPSGPGSGPGYFTNSGDNVAGNAVGQWVSTAGQGQSTSTVDEQGLNAAIAKYYEEQNAQNAALQSDPTYGSLLQAFHGGAEFDPGAAFSFTGKDLETEPGYQFGLTQGTQGIDRAQASRGNFLSGAALKELDRYNQDYAGTKFGDAFNRSLNTYNTNLGAQQNAWNTNLGAYNDNRNRVFNFLNGVSTLGQNSAAGTGAAALQVANNVGNNITGAANAQAASTIAGGNALQSGVNTALNQYNAAQNTQNWNNLLAQNSTKYTPGSSAASGFGSGAGFGNQDLGMNF